MRATGFLAFFLFAAIGAAGQGPPQEEVIQQLRSRWVASSEYTLAVAEQMPADRYSFRPTPEQMTFGEQLLHISEQNRLIFREIQGLAPAEKTPVAAVKPNVLAHLKETTALGLKLLQERMSPSEAEVAGLLNGMTLALDHTTHHRGQVIVYLRLNGIAPTEYRR